MHNMISDLSHKEMILKNVDPKININHLDPDPTLWRKVIKTPFWISPQPVKLGSRPMTAQSQNHVNQLCQWETRKYTVILNGLTLWWFLKAEHVDEDEAGPDVGDCPQTTLS